MRLPTSLYEARVYRISDWQHASILPDFSSPGFLLAGIPGRLTFVKLAEGGFNRSFLITMRFDRSSGLPVHYSPSSDNTAKTECIFMRGTKLSDVWLELEEPDIVLVLCQLIHPESCMIWIPFPAGGSLYYTNDLGKVAGRSIRLNDERFCVGTDARLHMWYGRMWQLDVNRGPRTPLSAFSFFWN